MDDEWPDTGIVRNSVRCGRCGDEIESEHKHDFKMCSCGAVGVDGGKSYLRRIGRGWIDTSIVEPVTTRYPGKTGY
ncbi:MAG: hypothetical protein GX970_07665 [Phyllobacteriaceae bacterium]|nr:hypothetical protein [Phyllobacteriaceae bacterium]